MVFGEENFRETLPIMLIVKGFDSTEFNETNQKPNEESPLVLVPSSGSALINTFLVSDANSRCTYF